MSTQWYKFEDKSPPINQYILIRNENSKSNNICPAVTIDDLSYIFISCAGCRWVVPPEPFTHWCLYPTGGLRTCNICLRSYLMHLCDTNKDLHAGCSIKNKLTRYEDQELQLKKMKLEEHRNNIDLIIYWSKTIFVVFIIFIVLGKIESVVTPLIKTELEFRYKKRYIKMYKEELKEEIKEASKFAVDSIKDVIKELKK